MTEQNITIIIVTITIAIVIFTIGYFIWFCFEWNRMEREKDEILMRYRETQLIILKETLSKNKKKMEEKEDA